MNRYPPAMLATEEHRQTQRERALGPGISLMFLLLLVFPGGNPAAEQPRTASPAALTELVDFLAVSDDGKPVTDLTAAEITFKVDGRIRPISSVQFVELASATPLDRGTQLSPPIAPPYGSNRLEDAGRLVMIAIDRESIRPGRERPAREAALRPAGRVYRTLRKVKA